MRPREYTDQDYLDALCGFYDKNGRAPFTKELRGMRVNGLPALSSLKHRFGGVRKAFDIAGVPPNREGGRIVHGRRASFVPIDPAKAEQITRDKQSFWANGGKHPTTWVHPYARRSA